MRLVDGENARGHSSRIAELVRSRHHDSDGSSRQRYDQYTKRDYSGKQIEVLPDQ